MLSIRPFLVIAAMACCWAPLVRAQGKDDAPKKKPKFTVGKDTTYVTGPIGKDGSIDYVAALNDKLREGVTPDNNANVLLWKAFGPHPDGPKLPAGFFGALGMPIPSEKGDYFVSVPSFTADKEAAGKLNDELDAATTRAWTAKDHPGVAQWLKANEKPLATVLEATKRTHYYRPTDGLLIASLYPGVQQCRYVTAALVARAMLHLGEGRGDAAWQDLLACHRLGRLVARGDTLIDALVGVAIDQVAASADLALIERGKLDSKRLQGCLRDLRALPGLPLMADKVDFGERFVFLQIAMFVAFHGVGILEPSADGIGALPRARTEDVDWDPALRNGNHYFTRLSTAMRGRDRALREKQLDEIQTELKTIKAKLVKPEEFRRTLAGAKNPAEAKGKYFGDILITEMIPSVRKPQQAADRSEQTERNLHLAFALAAYKNDEARYPLKLDALAPKYLAAIPNDLFSGKALIYRPAEDGYLLYSVGVNGKDDGGRGPDDPRSDDLVVRMPSRKMGEKKKNPD